MNTALRGSTLLLVTLFLTTLAGPLAKADDPPGEPQNLQILPADTELTDLKKIMVGVSSALGVKCTFCHDVKNYPSDEMEHKKQARAMFAMVKSINTEFFAYEGAPQVTCFTCHAGHEEPVHEFVLPTPE